MADKNRNKIFSEEDFDKPSAKGNLLTNYWKIILVALIVICAAACVIFIPRNCSNGGSTSMDTLTVDSIPSDTTAVVDSIPQDTAKVKADATMTKPSVAPVSDNTEHKVTKHESVDSSIPADVVKAAESVIRGNYGNNPDRRHALKERYEEIQNKVNEMYRNGQVR